MSFFGRALQSAKPILVLMRNILKTGTTSQPTNASVNTGQDGKLTDEFQAALEVERNRIDSLQAALAVERNRITQLESRPPWVLEFALTILTILALVLFAAVRMAQASFYRPLGVLPEEVGLNYAVTIGRSAMALVLILAILLPLAAALSYTPWMDILRDGKSMLKYGLPLSAAYLAYGWFTAEWFDRIGFPNYFLVFLSVVTAAGLLGLFWQADKRHRKSIQLIILAALPLILLLGMRQMINTGERLASDVKMGKEVEPFNPAALLLGVSAQSAEINWVNDKPPQGLVVPDRLMYLGEADGVLVLYIFTERPPRVLRISTETATIDRSVPQESSALLRQGSSL